MPNLFQRIVTTVREGRGPGPSTNVAELTQHLPPSNAHRTTTLAWDARHVAVMPQSNPRVPFQFDNSGAAFQTNYVTGDAGAPAYQPADGAALHVERLWNPKVKTFKGLKNAGGYNNNDNYYLPRFARNAPRPGTATPRSVSMLNGPKQVTASVGVFSVFVPTAEMRR